ncbi:HEPN domain-containing protein [candidate division KSB1 bacterium]|nr:HEPN domain-containing protein [candidate division KSB1 bacterium]
MNDLAEEWVIKAESDYRVAMRESQVTEQPSYDAVCFHAQQCAEKYAKAFLQENSIEFERTHNMLYLLSLCLSAEAAFDQYKPDFEFLDDFSVDVRYPGDFADDEDARAAIESMKRVRSFVRSKLGLSES